MDTNVLQIPSQLCEPFAGGFYAGRINIDGVAYAIVVAPKAEGEHTAAWSTTTSKIGGAASFFDGAANTRDMAAAGSPLAHWAQGLRIAGFDDWYLPSRDELELCYRAFKPTTEENHIWRSGDNPSSLPPGYPYTADSPAQTTVTEFKDPGSEAFADDWYWTSTQCAGGDAYAWCQYFDYGGQHDNRKDDELRARAVRRLPI